jgi:hypothetical protein
VAPSFAAYPAKRADRQHGTFIAIKSRAMFETLRSISWRAVIRKTAVEVGDDGCFGLAAQLAFYFLLALFPALLFLVALIGYVPVDNALDELLATLGTVAPRELVALLRTQLEEITSGSPASLLPWASWARSGAAPLSRPIEDPSLRRPPARPRRSHQTSANRWRDLRSRGRP